MTTIETSSTNRVDTRLAALPRVQTWVGEALREARDSLALLELIAETRISTPGTVRRRRLVQLRLNITG